MPITGFYCGYGGIRLSSLLRLETYGSSSEPAACGSNPTTPGSLTTFARCGDGGIRTHEALADPLVFKTSAFNRSATPPGKCFRPGIAMGKEGELPE